MIKENIMCASGKSKAIKRSHWTNLISWTVHIQVICSFKKISKLICFYNRANVIIELFYICRSFIRWIQLLTFLTYSKIRFQYYKFVFVVRPVVSTVCVWTGRLQLGLLNDHNNKGHNHFKNGLDQCQFFSALK